jgi:hypothetical protein
MIPEKILSKREYLILKKMLKQIIKWV